jgi:hypothetical protein
MYYISPNIRQVFFFKYCFLKKEGLSYIQVIKNKYEDDYKECKFLILMIFSHFVPQKIVFWLFHWKNRGHFIFRLIQQVLQDKKQIGLKVNMYITLSLNQHLQNSHSISYN